MEKAQMNLPLDALPFEFTTSVEPELTDSEKAVYKCIPVGKRNAISGHDLAKTVGIDERTVAAIVKRLRLKHCDIGSSRSSANYGYYRFGDAEEYSEYMQRAFKEKRDAEKVLKAMSLTPIAQQITTSPEKERKENIKND